MQYFNVTGGVVMRLPNYEKYEVWQKAMDLAENVYGLIRRLPLEERYALSDQMRRAAVSIPSNIAEGYSRGSDKEFIRFLYIARGSTAELETQLKLCVRFNYFSLEDIFDSMQFCTKVQMMLNALIRSISQTAI